MQVRLIGIDPQMTNLRIDEQLSALITTRKHTLPGSLGFGLDGQFLDAPPKTAGPQFALELHSAVAEFIPMIRVDDITFYPEPDGEESVSITVSWRDGYDRTTGKPAPYYSY